MTQTTSFNQLLSLLAGIALCLAGLNCSSPEQYKIEADLEVGGIIEQKWRDDFGGRANYKISDLPPSPNDIQIEKAVPPTGVLTLAQALELATAHNRCYQSEKESLYLKALDLTLVRHRYNPNPFAGGAGEFTKNNSDKAINTEAGFGFEQLLATGATISTGITAGWISILSGDLRSGLSSILSAAVTQPLLRGSGRKIALENLTQAERDTLYQVRRFNRFRKTFVVSIVSRYYLVLQKLDAWNIARENYDTLVWVHDRTDKLARAGRLPQFELDQAYQDKLRARDIVIQTKNEYQQALDELKMELSLSARRKLRLDEKELEALKSIGIAENNFDEAEAIATALNQRLDLANNADAVADAQRKVAVAADGLRAQLNLVADAEISSERRTNLSALDLDNNLDLGLELDLPLDRLAERNVYRKALINLTQRRRDYEQASDMVELEVCRAYRDLTEAADRHRVQIESLTLARKRFDNTFRLLQYARANTRDVLDAQNDLFKARNASASALVDYTIATLNFYRDAGVLQVQSDGLWQHKFSAAVHFQPLSK